MTRSIGPDIRAAARFVVAGIVLLFAFTAIYVAAFHAPRAKGFDVGVVGAPAAARRCSPRSTRDRGAFDVRGYDTRAGRARGAARHRRPRRPVAGDRILVAGALGRRRPTPPSARSRASRRGATVQDVQPLPRERLPRALVPVRRDRHGDPEPRLRRPAVAARARAARAPALGRRGRLRDRRRARRRVQRRRLVGALTGHFVAIAAVTALLAFAVAAAAHGLGHLAGPGGIVAAILVVLLLGVSSAGGAVTYQFEPGFYGAVSQLLPPGAALTATRNVQYFDSAATLLPLLVLGAWAAGGLLFGLLGERFGPHVRAAARAGRPLAG